MSNKELSEYLRSLVVGTDTQVPLENGGYVTAINFDNAATTPPFFSVMKGIMEFAPWYSSIHRGNGYKSVLSSDLYEEGRNTVKKFVNADEDRDVVIFTKSTTEAINMLAYTLAQENREQIVLSTEMEHLANDLPWRDKFQVDYVRVDKLGRLCLKDLEDKLLKYGRKVRLVAVTGASNVTGYINPIYKIAKLAHTHGAQILVDGAQLVPHSPMDMKPYSSLEHIDYLVFSAHKMYAPFGLGVLVGPKEIFAKTEPVCRGGGAVKLVTHQYIEWSNPPSRNEAGTPNVMGVVALIEAIKTLNSVGLEVIKQYEKQLIDYLIEELKNIPGIKLYCRTGKDEERVSLVSFNIKGIPHNLLDEMLSLEAGIAVRSGWFCAHPYAVKLLNIRDEDIQHYRKNPDFPIPGMVRASLGLYNNQQEIEVLLGELKKIIKRKSSYKNKYSRILAKKSRKLKI